MKLVCFSYISAGLFEHFFSLFLHFFSVFFSRCLSIIFLSKNLPLHIFSAHFLYPSSSHLLIFFSLFLHHPYIIIPILFPSQDAEAVHAKWDAYSADDPNLANSFEETLINELCDAVDEGDEDKFRLQFKTSLIAKTLTDT